jgi:hypothetical protein
MLFREAFRIRTGFEREMEDFDTSMLLVTHTQNEIKSANLTYVKPIHFFFFQYLLIH